MPQKEGFCLLNIKRRLENAEASFKRGRTALIHGFDLE
jgi:hypothetical protein